MKISVNDQSVELTEACVLDDVLKRFGIDPAERGIAVAVNEQVIRRAEWMNVQVAENDRIEIIRATQGG